MPLEVHGPHITLHYTGRGQQQLNMYSIQCGVCTVWACAVWGVCSVGCVQCGACTVWGVYSVGRVQCGVCTVWGVYSVGRVQCGVCTVWGVYSVGVYSVGCVQCGVCTVWGVYSVGCVQCGVCTVWGVYNVRCLYSMYRMQFNFRGVYITRICNFHVFVLLNSRLLGTVVLKYSRVKYLRI